MRLEPGMIDLPIPTIPPPVVGIYFLLREGKCVYVGQSTHVIERARHHVESANGASGHVEPKLFDAVRYLACSEADLDRLEQEYISLLNPEYNTNPGGYGKRSLSGYKVTAREHHDRLRELRDVAHSILTHTDESAVRLIDLYERALARIEYETCLRKGVRYACIRRLGDKRIRRIFNDDPRFIVDGVTLSVRLARTD